MKHEQFEIGVQQHSLEFSAPQTGVQYDGHHPDLLRRIVAQRNRRSVGEKNSDPISLPNALGLQMGSQRVDPPVQGRKGKLLVLADDRGFLRLSPSGPLQHLRGEKAI